MGDMVEFPSNGSTCGGYLALPDGAGPGVIVIQEWWGLVDHITDVADRFAREGFVALAPDLYHGQKTQEPDEAQKLLMAMDLDRASRDMSGAVAYVREHASLDPKKVGCVGFCMGGAMTLALAAIAPVDAAVPFYGIPLRHQPDWEGLRAPVQGHFAEHDDFFPPAVATEFFDRLASMGKDVELHVYPGAHHGFFNDDNAEAHDPEAARTAWDRTLDFLRTHLR
jgi:carboxymethylenebutenolidase